MNAKKFTPFLIAAALPMLLFSWFLPQGAVQFDLWLLWLVAMVLLGLPMTYLELALAKRSKNSVWLGMQTLTRESDAKTYWRIFAFFSVLLALFLGAGSIARYSMALVYSLAQLNVSAIAGIPSYAIAFALTVIALILSPLKSRLLAVGVAFLIAGGVLSLVMGGQNGIAMTNVSFSEWAIAVVAALFSVGVGTGLYWFLDAKTPIENAAHPLTGKVLPIWLTQLVFGAAGFVVASATIHPIGILTAAVGVLLFASFLFYYAGAELAARFGKMAGFGGMVVLALLICALPPLLVGHILVVVGLVTTLFLAIFAGYSMKMSHLRKSLNFASEARYNLWRVAVRWLVPLAVLSALVGWFLK